MRNWPQLKVTAQPEMFGAGGRVRYTYEWEGDLTGPILLDGRTAANLPWPLALVEEMPWGHSSWYVGRYIRLDVRGAWYRRGWLIAARRIKRAWQWLLARCVLTLHIWGLASYEPGRMPSWRDVGVRRNRNA